VSATATVEFRTDENRDVVVRLTAASQETDDGMAAFEVVIDADGVHAERGVLTYGGDGLDTFFQDLAAEWKGWSGVRRWDALENGMSIEASHGGNRVELLFILRRDFDADAWQLRVPVRIAPGESLRNLARATAELVELWRHS
jgi:hypothetical protein